LMSVVLGAYAESGNSQEKGMDKSSSNEVSASAVRISDSDAGKAVSAAYQYQSIGVNSRTGTLSLSVPLGGLSMLGRSPDFTLMASYSQTIVPDSGYRLANHFQLALPSYNIKNNTIMSSTGQQLIVDGVLNSGSGYTKQKFKYHKLQDVEFYYNTTSGKPVIKGSYLLYPDHKEYFNTKGLIDKIEYDSGARLTFQYNESYRLASITAWVPNQAGILQQVSSIKLSNGASPRTVTSEIGNGLSFVTDLEYENNELTAVTYNKQTYGDLYRTVYGHDSNTGLITSVTNALTAKTEISYGTIKARLSDNTKETSMPVVTKLKRLPRTPDEQAVVTEYAYGDVFQSDGNYTGNNYTGYPKYVLNTKPEAADALFNNNANGYEYVTQTKSIAADGSTVITRETYNHKGLMVSKLLSTGTGDKVIETNLSYCDTPVYGVSQNCSEIRDNSATYQLPKFTEATSYSKDINGNTVRTTSVTTEKKYNDAGSVTYSKAPNGTVTTTSYYDEINSQKLFAIYPKEVVVTTADGYKHKSENNLELFNVAVKPSEAGEEEIFSMPKITSTTSYYQAQGATSYSALKESITDWSANPLKLAYGTTPYSSGLPTYSITKALTANNKGMNAKLAQNYGEPEITMKHLSYLSPAKGVYMTGSLNKQMMPNIASVSVYNSHTGALLWSLSGDAAILTKDDQINPDIVISNKELNFSVLDKGIKENRLQVSRQSYDAMGRVVETTSYVVGDNDTVNALSMHNYYGTQSGYMWQLSRDALGNIQANIYNSQGALLESYDNSSGKDGGLITDTLPESISLNWIQSTLRLVAKNSYNRAGKLIEQISMVKDGGSNFATADTDNGYYNKTTYRYDNKGRVIKATTLSSMSSYDETGKTLSSDEIEQAAFAIYFDKAPAGLNNSQNKGYTVKFSAVKLPSGKYQVNSNVAVSVVDYTVDSPSNAQVIESYVIPEPQGDKGQFSVSEQQEMGLKLLLQINHGLCHKTAGVCEVNNNQTSGYYSKSEYFYNGLGLYQAVASPIETTIKLQNDPVAKKQQVQLIKQSKYYPELNKQVEQVAAIKYEPNMTRASYQSGATILAKRVTHTDPLSDKSVCVSIGLDADSCV
ncbi:hypothetical protein, partial [Fangia hongkongensis]